MGSLASFMYGLLKVVIPFVQTSSYVFCCVWENWDFAVNNGAESINRASDVLVWEFDVPNNKVAYGEFYTWIDVLLGYPGYPSGNDGLLQQLKAPGNTQLDGLGPGAYGLHPQQQQGPNLGQLGMQLGTDQVLSKIYPCCL